MNFRRAIAPPKSQSQSSIQSSSHVECMRRSIRAHGERLGSQKEEKRRTTRLRRLLRRTIDARDGGGGLLGGIKLHESVPSRPPLTTRGNLHASNPGGVGEEVAKLLFGGAPRDVSDVQSRRRPVRRFVFGGHACLSFVGSRVCLCAQTKNVRACDGTARLSLLGASTSPARRTRFGSPW